MLIPTTHIAFGALAAVFSSVILHTPLTEKELLWGMVFGFLPDVDYFYYLLKKGKRPAKYSYEHRRNLTHSFFPNVMIALGILFLAGKFYGLVYILGIFTHLALDSLHSPWGIRWFWPFSSHYYSYSLKTGFNTFTAKQLKNYANNRWRKDWVRRFTRIKNPYFIFEVSVACFFIIFLIRFLT